MKSGLKEKHIYTLIIGGLLSLFFISGFFAGNLLNSYLQLPSSEEKKNALNKTGISKTSVSRQEALNKVKEYLQQGPFRYPFVKNVSTLSVQKDERLGENNLFYNWTLEFVVERNPFNRGIYRVPENQTSATNKMTLFVSQDGEYFFPTAPTSTEIKKEPARSGRSLP